MVSPAFLKMVNDPSYHRDNLARKSFAIARAMEFALHAIKRTSSCRRKKDGELQTALVCVVRFPRLERRQ